ncbi:MAG TPA: hypothetical protein VIT38_04325 [Allosphingosinicella sp.]
MKRQAGEALAKAILDRFQSFAGRVEIVAPVSRPWSSIAFAGARHRFSLHIRGEGAGAAADLFLGGLDAPTLSQPGHILADIALTGDLRAEEGDSVRLSLEALTVESG